ncbi:MAG: c-type cytochrome [Deltaproteobacteria bacterium]|nr:c-type cytochrome [Deltaproteobacteria bacterium]
MSRLALAVALILAASTGACTGPKLDLTGSGAGPITGSGGDPNLSQPIVLGGQLYAKYCALCHGDNAEGYKADNAPSLVNPEFLVSASDEFLRSSIGRGRPGTAMAGYAKAIGGPLDDASVRAIVAFLRKDAPAPRALPAVSGGDPVLGKATYTGMCASCHGTLERRGEAIWLANPQFVATAAPAFLAHGIKAGRPGTKMIPWGNSLGDAEVANLVAYIQSWPKAGQAVAPVDPTPRPLGPIVINPDGKAPTFTLREDRFVPAAQVKAALDAKQRLVIIDSRAPSDWLHTRIPGAISIPHYDMKAIDQVPNDGTWVLAYCACPHHASGIVVDELRKRGYKNTAVIDEGILGWQRAGYPAVDAEGKPAVMPPALPPEPPAALQPGPQ